MLWGLGVGYVISGLYFGWNLGLEKAGSLGFGIATACIALLYITFTFSYAELSCAIPKAGGAFDYCRKALGDDWGFIAGMAQTIEFVFAPPAIALAIGAYFHILIPEISLIYFSIIAYLLFTLLNIIGVKSAARFELLITILAVAELLFFAGLTLPHFHLEKLRTNALPNGYAGIFAALPFAIWFFLGIEGLANVAEEAKHPQKDIQKGFGWAIFTLVILTFLVFLSSVGIDGWKAIVYKNGISGATSDSPLPLALAKVAGDSAWTYHLLISIGICGLVASFNGLILASGRSIMELGRAKFAPSFLGKISPKFKTPIAALLFNLGVGIIALLTERTAEIITISVFGALSLYILSMIALIKLRKSEPNLHRPFKVPLYPLFPILALLIATVSIIAMIYYNGMLSLYYFAVVLLCYLFYKLYKHLTKPVKTDL